MSSIKYSTALTPDPALRRLVLLSGLVAALAGVAIIISLPMPWQWRALAAVGWCAWAARDLWLIASGHKVCHSIELGADGSARVFDGSGCCEVATLRAGSVVLPPLAWLRLQTGSGRLHGELLRRKTQQTHQWRRMQVIWRHLGARQ